MNLICETCGKNHEGKFGTGRFCNRNCAATRKHTEESKAKLRKKHSEEHRKNISKSLLGKKLSDEHKRKLKKALSPETRKKISDALKGRKVSKETKIKISKSSKGKTGGWRPYSGSGKRGTYKGITYQSSWELAFIKYCFEHKIKIENCKEKFKYFFDEKERTYHPDFYLPESDEIVEIKGYKKENLKAQLDAVKKAGRNLILIDESKIHKYMEE